MDSCASDFLTRSVRKATAAAGLQAEGPLPVEPKQMFGEQRLAGHVHRTGDYSRGEGGRG